MQQLKIFKLIGLTAATLIVAGCGLLEKTGEAQKWPTEKLYAQAQEAMSAGDWPHCVDYFSMLEGRDPFGPHAQQAQINIAYCSWKDNEIEAALQAVNRFIRWYPDHPQIGYAYYLKGLINFNDSLGLFGNLSKQDLSERDPKALRNAYDAFKVVVNRYPDSKYAADAVQRMRYIVNALAAHEVHVARYYYRRGAYIAAANRAQIALAQYRGAPATEEALRIMALSYRALGEQQLAEDTERVLYATFPHSRYLANKLKMDERSSLP